MGIESKEIRKWNNFVQAFSTDYFVVLAVDFTDDIVEILQAFDEIVPSLKEYLATPRTWQEFVDFYCDKFIEDDSRESFKKDFSAAELWENLSKKDGYTLYSHYLHQDKIVCPAEGRLVDISDENRQGIVAFRFVDDILMRDATMRQQSHMIRTLRASYTAIYHVDLDQDKIIVLWVDDKKAADPSVYEYGYLHSSYKDMIRYSVEKKVRNDDKRMVLEMTDAAYIRERLKHEDEYSFFYQLNPAWGSGFYSLRVAKVKDKEPDRYVVITLRCADKEVREIKEVLAATEQANHTKTDFLSRMSHDIRTPMNVIIGTTAIAKAHLEDREKLEGCMEKISAASHYMLDVVNDILDMAKIELGTMELREEEFGLSALFDEILDMVKPQISAKGHDVKLFFKDVVHDSVIGDRVRLKQAFHHILGNAIKYTPNGGRIAVSVYEKQTYGFKTGSYEFVFEDNGIGMSTDFVRKMFNPFVRGEDSRTNKVPGTGLGMSITKNIIEMMGGNIGVESVYGKGTKITVSLVLKRQNTEMSETDKDKLAGLSVLVADTDEESCVKTCKALSDSGMKSEWVLSAQEALDRIIARHKQGEDYFAVILDWKMPDIGGPEMTRRIRKEVESNVPIIIISAYDWSDIELDARLAGANAFISKRIMKSGLINAFSGLVNSRRNDVQENNDLKILEELDFSSKRILLVEDNELNREIAKEIITTSKAMVETAEDGREAVEMFVQAPNGYYDMILMDIQMPNLNGCDAAIAIRASQVSNYDTIPIVAMTANTFEEDIRAALNAGMNQHMAKPINLRQLYDVMIRWL